MRRPATLRHPLANVHHMARAVRPPVDLAQDAVARVEELSTLIAYHNQRYYEFDEPEVSDGEYDALLLEYDTPRSGDFSPLQHVLPTSNVVLGLLTTKEGALEDAALIEQRIREAAQYVPLERLSLSTQCGFASAGAGNPITAEEQSAKLRRVVEVARKVWAQQIGACIGESTARYFRMQQLEARSQIEDLEQAVESLRELEQ